MSGSGRLALLWLLACSTSHARAEDDPKDDIPPIVDQLPQQVQDVIEGMAESRDPAPRFLFGVLGLPRTRFGSGTAWLPDDSPLYAVVPSAGRWGFLIGANLYVGYDWFGSRRGGQRFMGRNTLSGAVFRTFPRGEFSGRLALSLEPLTIGARGYPLILQTGQTRDGERWHDRQYALDFFRELALSYSHELKGDWALSFYAALSGEPALGPPSFTQRASALADPLAPIGLQWQEMSHASYGVLTVGAFSRTLRVEASWFNGEVPRARPYSLALRTPDSYSVRVSYNPSPSWSLQTSYGFLLRPVRLEPERSVHRVSLSVSYARFVAPDSGLAVTVSLAERVTKGGEHGFALLTESYWNIDGHNTLFGRGELLQKSASELVVAAPAEQLFAVGSLVAGYAYYFGPFVSIVPGLGLRTSLGLSERELEAAYGARALWGVMAFAQLRTAALEIDY